MSQEIFLCRPDSKHWCVECCEGRSCSNLGELPDRTRGCLGYGGRQGKGGLPQTPFCQEFNCLKGEYSSDLGTTGRIRQEIAQMPPGKFKMGMVLRKLGLL